MKSCFGNAIEINLFGESHSEAMGVVINGLAPGIELSLDKIADMLFRRRPKGKISTARQEKDEFSIVSGFFNGRTTGTPLCLIIKNSSQRSADYDKTKTILRPSHADFTAYKKYNGYQDYRGGGHFSGRLTAPIVAAGAICMQILNSHNIRIGTHIAECGGIADDNLCVETNGLAAQLESLSQKGFPTLSEKKAEDMIAAISNAADEGDSVGGILETAIIGLEAGIGEPFFYSIESVLSSLMFSIPAIKGVEFGRGFEFSGLRGSEANDSFFYDGDIKTVTNNNGGINGGVSNGMPIVMRCAVKPTPSIFKRQQTVDISNNKGCELAIEGRHDPAIIHRAAVVADSMAAIGLLDLICERYGYMWQTKEK